MRLNKFFTFALCASLLAFTGCSDDDDDLDVENAVADSATEDTGSTTDTSDKFVAPDYADDYSATIADWGHNYEWNLANVHDPTVAYFKGYYYMYGTDASYGNAHDGHGHFFGRRSKDLVNWEWIGSTMSDAPQWLRDSVNTRRVSFGLKEIADEDFSFGYWAPTVRAVTNEDGDEVLRMYYSIVIDNHIGNGSATVDDGTWNELAFIGMQETSYPEYNLPWTDKGYVLSGPTDKFPNWNVSSTDYGNAYGLYNAIDPSYIVTSSGEHWLIYGSWHSGIAAVQLDPQTGKLLNADELGSPWTNPENFGHLISTRANSSRWQGSEGPEIIEYNGDFYLFLAYDELDVPYNTRVVRSNKANPDHDGILGNYLDVTGRNSTNGRGECFPVVTHPYKFNDHSGWVGISHCCVFQENGTDRWFFCCQGRLPEGTNGNAYANAIMMGHVRQLFWVPASKDNMDDIWPVVLPERYANVPDYGTITADSLVGNWQHIKLAYQKSIQDEAETLTLKSDGTMSGALTGNWSYDESTKYLTLGNYIVRVERELDWEADPRVPTIVYAGLFGEDGNQDEHVTFWGKKEQ